MPKKVRNFHAVNAHFRRSGPMVDRKKEQDKYATRASRAIEDYKHNEEHEDIEEYEHYMFLLDESDMNDCGSILSGCAFYGSRNTYFEFNEQSKISYLHSMQFLKAMMEPDEDESSKCVWKEY